MFDANEVINGLYGFVYDENGKQMQETKAFEANVDYDKEEVLQAGKLMKGHKVSGTVVTFYNLLITLKEIC